MEEEVCLDLRLRAEQAAPPFSTIPSLPTLSLGPVSHANGSRIAIREWSRVITAVVQLSKLCIPLQVLCHAESAVPKMRIIQCTA